MNNAMLGVAEGKFLSMSWRLPLRLARLLGTLVSRTCPRLSVDTSVRFTKALLTELALLLALPCLAAPVNTYKVINKYPHSTDSYTEGFFYLNGLFYEGTGRSGHSAILVTQPETGRPVQRLDLPPQYFGEGIVDWGPNLIEWTWQTHTGFVFDRFSLRTLAQFHYDGEGWGITRTAKELITSDGTAILRFRNPNTFAATRHITVHEGAQPIDQLNELEYIPDKTGGEIYANIWHSDRIARISPQDGHVIAWIDLAHLLADDQKPNAESVLNGIAYDPKSDRLFVTGKQWPLIFEIKVLPAAKQPASRRRH
jgi:glutamine cyclotransferase